MCCARGVPPPYVTSRAEIVERYRRSESFRKSLGRNARTFLFLRKNKPHRGHGGVVRPLLLKNRRVWEQMQTLYKRRKDTQMSGFEIFIHIIHAN